MADIFGFAINMSFQDIIILLAALAAFIIISRKIMSTVFNLIWISVASAVFPFAMRFVGLDFPTDINSVAFFVALGFGLYVLYILGRFVYTLLGIAENAGKAATYPLRSARKSRDEKTRKKIENLVKEKEKDKGKGEEE